MSARLSTGNVSLLEQEYDQQVQALLESLQRHSIDPAAQRDLKNHVSSMYSVFVQAIGKAAEQQHAISQNSEMIRSLKITNDETRQFRQVVETKLTGQMNAIEATIDAGEVADATLAGEVRKTLLQIEDSSVWQKRIHRIADENEQLYDKIAALQGELMDTQFSNQSLKTELCGRIQQLQLMSKGMASAGDKMYQRVLHEMEQNSMKAYAQHGRKVSTPQKAASPADQGTTTKGTARPASPKRPAHQVIKGQPKYRRQVQLQKNAAGGLGLRISGGVIDGVQHPVLIQGVEPGKPAAESGQIYGGDWIVETCGKSTQGLDHRGLVALLQKSGPSIDFVLHSDQIPKVPSEVKMAPVPGFTLADIGRRVLTDSGLEGTLRFVGSHAMTRKGARLGIELMQPAGKNNGTIEGNRYFTCSDNHGLLTVPAKVKFAPELVANPTSTTAEDPKLKPEVELEAAPAIAVPTEVAALQGASKHPEVPVDRGNGAPVEAVEVQSITQRMEMRRATDEPPRSSPMVDPNRLRAAARSSDGAYSPAPDSKYSMGMAMEVQSVQQTEASESASLFSTT